MTITANGTAVTGIAIPALPKDLSEGLSQVLAASVGEERATASLRSATLNLAVDIAAYCLTDATITREATIASLKASVAGWTPEQLSLSPVLATAETIEKRRKSTSGMLDKIAQVSQRLEGVLCEESFSVDDRESVRDRLFWAIPAEWTLTDIRTMKAEAAVETMSQLLAIEEGAAPDTDPEEIAAAQRDLIAAGKAAKLAANTAAAEKRKQDAALAANKAALASLPATSKGIRSAKSDEAQAIVASLVALSPAVLQAVMSEALKALTEAQRTRVASAMQDDRQRRTAVAGAKVTKAKAKA